MNNLQGSCHCGEISYQIESAILNVVNCHCNFCRSHSGASFSTYAVIDSSSLRITKGEESVSDYRIKEGIKHFCKTCGTPIFNLNNQFPGLAMIYHGTLANRNNVKPQINIWCESELGWIKDIDNMQSLPGGIERKRA